MAASTDPVFVASPKFGVGNITAANTARDGSGTIVTVYTAGTNGARIHEVVVKAETDLADSVVILWLKISGGSWYLFDEFDVGNPAAGSTTVTALRFAIPYRFLILGPSDVLGATITVAPTTGDCNVFAFGGDY